MRRQSCRSLVTPAIGEAHVRYIQGKARVSATITAERFASNPPLVKLARALAGKPNLAASHASVCRSISFAAGEVRQVSQLWVVHRHQRVRNDRRRCHARIEEAEVTRMSDMNVPRSHHLFYIGAHFFQRYWLCKIVPCETILDLLGVTVGEWDRSRYQSRVCNGTPELVKHGSGHFRCDCRAPRRAGRTLRVPGD